VARSRGHPPPDVAERLGVPDKTKSVLRRENVFYADDDPVNRVTTYVPWSIAEGTGLLQDEVPHRYGIHGVLEDQHHVMTRIREEVSTRMPRPDEVTALHLRPGVPVLDVWHTERKVTATGPERRALSGSAPPASRAPKILSNRFAERIFGTHP
jgi:GntR family transcriptional regulator